MTARLSPHDLAALAAKPQLNRRERRAAHAFLARHPAIVAEAKARIGGDE